MDDNVPSPRYYRERYVPRTVHSMAGQERGDLRWGGRSSAYYGQSSRSFSIQAGLPDQVQNPVGNPQEVETVVRPSEELEGMRNLLSKGVQTDT